MRDSSLIEYGEYVLDFEAMRMIEPSDESFGTLRFSSA